MKREKQAIAKEEKQQIANERADAMSRIGQVQIMMPEDLEIIGKQLNLQKCSLL